MERPVVYAYLEIRWLSFDPSTRASHRRKVAFDQASTASSDYHPGAIFTPALPGNTTATAERQLEPAAQPRPSVRFVPHLGSLSGILSI